MPPKKLTKFDTTEKVEGESGKEKAEKKDESILGKLEKSLGEKGLIKIGNKTADTIINIKNTQLKNTLIKDALSKIGKKTLKSNLPEKNRFDKLIDTLTDNDIDQMIESMGTRGILVQTLGQKSRDNIKAFFKSIQGFAARTRGAMEAKKEFLEEQRMRGRAKFKK